jgi:Rrf2 family protein
MVRISRTVEYALVAIQHMALRPGELVSARDLADRLTLPAGLIAKVLQRLAVAGMLESEQGVHGGYRLSRDPAAISFLELSEAVEGPLRPAACDTGGDGSCDRGTVCTVAGPVHTLSARIIDLLSETTLGSLLNHGEHGKETVSERGIDR